MPVRDGDSGASPIEQLANRAEDEIGVFEETEDQKIHGDWNDQQQSTMSRVRPA